MSLQAFLRRAAARPATLAQVRAPIWAGRVVRSLTGGRSRRGEVHGDVHAHGTESGPRITGLAAADRAAGVPAGPPPRTSGIAAADAVAARRA